MIGENADRLWLKNTSPYRLNKPYGNVAAGSGSAFPVVFDQDFATLYGAYAGNLSGAPFTIWDVVEDFDVQVNNVDGVLENGSNVGSYSNSSSAFEPEELSQLDTSKPNDIVIQFRWVDVIDPPGSISTVNIIPSPAFPDNNEITIRRDKVDGTVILIGLSGDIIEDGNVDISEAFAANTIHTLNLATQGAGNSVDIIINGTLKATRTVNPAYVWWNPRLGMSSINGDDGYRSQLRRLTVSGFPY